MHPVPNPDHRAYEPTGETVRGADAIRGALLESARRLFEQTFSAKPTAYGYAPGRVNLIGEHIDYSGGFVLPIAIERQTIVVGDLIAEPRLDVVSTARPDEIVRIPLSGLSPGIVKGWSRYVAGVVALSASAAAPENRGFRLAIASDVPLGAGLSSSAALEVATAMCIHALCSPDTTPDLAKLVRLCRRAEHEYAGVPCGIMDQYISANARRGTALLIDCHSQSHREVPIADEVEIVIADSGVKHELADGEYAKRRAACERVLAAIRAAVGARESLRHCSLADLAAASPDPVDARCARHAITECARTLAAAIALERRDWNTAGKLMGESHRSLRDDYRVSCTELDVLAEIMSAIPGVFGARMTGGGFGGCVIALTDRGRAQAVCDELAKENRSPLVFATSPASGAGFGRI